VPTQGRFFVWYNFKHYLGELTLYSHRFQRNIQLTYHVADRMTKRFVTEEMLYDLIETGDIRHKTETDVWLYKHYLDREDNLICAAAILNQAVIIKTVMINWKLQENAS
jgi:YD repeat-containing protein